MENNETYLSDWFENRISDDELKQFVSDEDFKAYQKLKTTLGNYSVNTESDYNQSFEAIKTKIAVVKYEKPKVFSMWRYAAIAAVLALVGSVVIYAMQEHFVATGTGKTASVTLPDESTVVVNANSKLSYSNLFSLKRTLHLEGEAFFSVTKGSRFTVKTPQGSVAVLGTKFNVSSVADYFEVTCYEGKVGVRFSDKYILLTPHETVRFNHGEMGNFAIEKEEKPSWVVYKETEFKNTPFWLVIQKLENQYGYRIQYPDSLQNTTFTGAFTHDNLDIALKSVCLPMHLQFKSTGKDKIELFDE